MRVRGGHGCQCRHPLGSSWPGDELSLERDMPSAHVWDLWKGLTQGHDVILHVLEILQMQLSRLETQLGILTHHQSLREILRFVPINLLPDVVAGIHIGHHVVQYPDLSHNFV